jgi:F-box protein 11
MGLEPRGMINTMKSRFKLSAIFVATLVITALLGIAIARLSMKPDPLPEGAVTVGYAGQFKTITEAIAASRKGGKIIVQPGLYRESVQIEKSVEIIGLNRKDSFWNRLRSYFFRKTSPFERDVVIEGTYQKSGVLMRTDFAVIRNVSLHAATTWWTGQNASNNPPVAPVTIPYGKLILENCEITSQQGDAVAIGGAEADPEIVGCQIHGSLTGVNVMDGANASISRSELFDNAWGLVVTGNSKSLIDGCDMHSDKVDVYGCNGGDVLVRNSKLHDGIRSGISLDEQSKCSVEDSEIYGHLQDQEIMVRHRSTLSIRRTRVHDGKQDGIILSEHSTATIEDCEMYGNGNAAIVVGQHSEASVKHCKLYRMTHGGILFEEHSSGVVEDCDISDHIFQGVIVESGSNPTVRNSRIHRNNQGGVVVTENASATVENCDLRDNQKGGLIVSPDSKVSSAGNQQ